MTATIMSAPDAVRAVRDGHTVLIGGFGMAGMPVDLIDALIEHGAGDLTVVSNNAATATPASRRCSRPAGSGR